MNVLTEALGVLLKTYGTTAASSISGWEVRTPSSSAGAI